MQRFFDRFDGQTRRDASRIAVQTIVASAAVYLVMRWAGLPEMSWAVISALFVIHANSDSSLTAAAGRLAGTVLGTGLGLLLIHFVGGSDLTLVRLVVAAGLMNAIGGLWPSLRYGAVPAAVIVLEQEMGIGSGALQLAVAVFIGTGVGALSSILFWPDFGRSRALRHLVSALRACRDLVEASMEELLHERERRLVDLHRRFLRNLQNTNSIAAHTWLTPRVGGAGLADVAHATERLWHSLVIVDRITHDPAMQIAPDDFKAIEPQARKVQRSASAYLESLISQLRTGKRRADHSELARRLSEALAISDRVLDSARDDRKHDRAVQALLFAFYEIAKNLSEIDSLCVGAERRRQAAPWWRRALAPLVPTT